MKRKLRQKLKYNHWFTAAKTHQQCIVQVMQKSVQHILWFKVLKCKALILLWSCMKTVLCQGFGLFKEQKKVRPSKAKLKQEEQYRFEQEESGVITVVPAARCLLAD